ncbi:uncharacterized protein LOC134251531 [Saccostrea cucullata]|uniref:uncharacterized protein LOC134251531 n=1 Tax=Saccostrea cuccullata TaxID=36930 RepID=UPI002ED6501C
MVFLLKMLKDGSFPHRQYRESNTCTSSPSRSFGDSEEEWIRLAEESFESVFESGNSPDDHHISEEFLTGLKRKFSEAEDSLILTKRKGNFTKYKALERRKLGNGPISPIHVSIASSPESTSNPASPINISTSSFQFPPTPQEFNSVFNLPAPDHILKPNANTTVPPPVVLPGTSSYNQTLGVYHLN